MINKAGGNLNNVPDNYSGRKTNQVELNKTAHFAPPEASSKIDLSGAAGKTDRVEISRKPSGKDSVLSDLRRKIINEINWDTDPQILEELKEKYNSGELKPDPDEIARILLQNL